MATQYPASRFTGYDYHEESIDAARKRASEAGLTDDAFGAPRYAPRVSFEVATAQAFPEPAGTSSRSSTACTTCPTRCGRPARP